MKPLFYPTNITELATKGLGYIIFVAKPWGTPVEEMIPLADVVNKEQPPAGGVMLPIPNGSIAESLNHSWSAEKTIKDELVQGAANMVPNAELIKKGLSKAGGMGFNPNVQQEYRSTAPRTWSGSFVFIPESLEESSEVQEIIRSFKMWSSPDIKDAIGATIEFPYVFTIKFSNPVINKSMKLHQMVLNNVDVEYFSNGVPVTYSDGMPKQITMKLSFTEMKVKTKSDWEK
jgi:hypothetical protein